MGIESKIKYLALPFLKKSFAIQADTRHNWGTLMLCENALLGVTLMIECRI